MLRELRIYLVKLVIKFKSRGKIFVDTLKILRICLLCIFFLEVFGGNVILKWRKN